MFAGGSSSDLEQHSNQYVHAVDDGNAHGGMFRGLVNERKKDVSECRSRKPR